MNSTKEEVVTYCRLPLSLIYSSPPTDKQQSICLKNFSAVSTIIVIYRIYPGSCNNIILGWIIYCNKIVKNLDVYHLICIELPYGITAHINDSASLLSWAKYSSHNKIPKQNQLPLKWAAYQHFKQRVLISESWKEHRSKAGKLKRIVKS